MPEAALLGIAASLAAGAMTGIGGLLVALAGAPDERRQNLLTGFAAGVMIAAAVFSLILPGIERAQAAGASFPGAAGAVLAAAGLGALVIARTGHGLVALAHRRLIPSDADASAWNEPGIRGLALFVIAMTLHNLPEGIAVGVSFMSGDRLFGWATATGIGVQNIAEGMAVAAVLASLGWNRSRAAAGALATGLIEPVGGTIGTGMVQASLTVLPAALGFSAGAMLFVVMGEMLPRTARRIEHGSAVAPLMAGLAVMTFLDLTLG